MKLTLPIKVVARGKITLGPKPGTPEYEVEQAERRARQLAKLSEEDTPTIRELHGDAQHGGEERGD